MKIITDNKINRDNKIITSNEIDRDNRIITNNKINRANIELTILIEITRLMKIT